MKKTTILLFISSLVIMSCSSVKSTQKAINTGDYEKAISLSVENLSKNKTKEKNQPYIVMLEEAFAKATERDEARISFLQKENNPANLKTIYNLFQDLKYRQERIKPLLPLKLLSGRYAEFDFVNYDDAIIKAKDDYISYLYDNGRAIYEGGKRNKMNYRRAYQELSNLDRIAPNYKDVRNLLEESHVKGTDFVFVSVYNETNQIIPRRLERDLLAIDTYGLNDFWTVYHSQRVREVKYDFDLELNFRRIEVSPEQIREKEIIKERKIKDGYKYLLDDKGNFVKDSLGKKIKVDKFITARCKLYRFTQFKSSRVVGVVKYIDNNSKQLIEQFPLDSEFVFEHSYANYDGDKRALEESFLDLIRIERARFPSNEQMVYDTGADLKEKLKHIITRNKFRN
ncbi:hypothetical protein [Tenacibaculum sp. 190130A14a]|uniref:Lipoprotein n=1 Tax=Tenacibaculum polynesiense TaxID=3137857 RepID=A0ABP1F4E1_9FLAO